MLPAKLEGGELPVAQKFPEGTFGPSGLLALCAGDVALLGHESLIFREAQS